jgi:hypothetical protein
VKLLTKKRFNDLAKRDNYWGGRWEYFKKVIELIKKEKFKSILELGPWSNPIVENSDIMDLDNRRISKLKYKWDARKTPWPIEDKKYDLFIALQVWEHLYKNVNFLFHWSRSLQKKAFKEVIRISKNPILSFPYKWDCPNCPSHNQIDERITSKWTLGIKPVKISIVGNRIIYFFKFKKEDIKKV